MFLFDAVVILISWAVYLNHRSMMYTLVALFVSARVIDFVQEGAYAARAAFIISANQDKIATKITSKWTGRDGFPRIRSFHKGKSRNTLLRCWKK